MVLHHRDKHFTLSPGSASQRILGTECLSSNQPWKQVTLTVAWHLSHSLSAYTKLLNAFAQQSDCS